MIPLFFGPFFYDVYIFPSLSSFLSVDDRVVCLRLPLCISYLLTCMSYCTLAIIDLKNSSTSGKNGFILSGLSFE